jgi:S-formylglutathione hydrolase FrmB
MSGARRVLVAAVGVLALLAPAVSTAQAAGSHRTTPAVRILSAKRTGRVVLLTISTPAFATSTHVDVDLPVGYRSHPHKRWPVAYFLAGISNTYKSFNSVVDGVKLTEHFPAIVVSPNGDSGWWSDWYNSGKYGAPKYESFVIDQLIPLIDKTFRTIPKRSERAIAGVSMGGYGSMMLAARHPDLFADAASLSGAVDTDFQPIASVLTLSPELQGVNKLDAIYGPQSTQEVRWRGHNPTTLAGNLRGLRLQVRSANGVPNPAIGENVASADSVSCVIESGVHEGSIDLNQELDRLRIPHLWKDYGAGCHTAPNFEREISATLAVFKAQLAHPKPAPKAFNYESIAPSFHIYGWSVRADRARALEFLALSRVSRRGLTITGSGRTTVTTPALFRGASRVTLRGATRPSAVPDSGGRITFQVDLGTPDPQQQYTVGAVTKHVTRTVRFGR